MKPSPLTTLCTLAAALLLACCSLPAARAQYGPATLLSGGTNNIPTNYVFTFPSTIKISLGAWSTVGLHFEAHTVSTATTQGWTTAWVRSVDGTTYESNVWMVITNARLNGALTNRYLTNLTVGPFTAIRPLWMSNENQNAADGNCLTNVTIKYLLR